MPDSSRPRRCCGELPTEITGEYQPAHRTNNKWVKFECPVCGHSTQGPPNSRKYKYSEWNWMAAKTLVERLMKTPDGPERIAEAIELNIPMDLTATGACPSCDITIKNRKQMFCMACGQKLKFN